MTPLVSVVFERLLHHQLDGAAAARTVRARSLHLAVNDRLLDVDDLEVSSVLGQLRSDVILDHHLKPKAKVSESGENKQYCDDGIYRV